MNRRSLLLTWITTGLVFVLSACVGGKNIAPAVVYDFGLPVAVSSADARWAAVVLEVRSPPWFDSLGVNYRLAYDDPLKSRQYLDSRWVANPASLLAQRLRQQLGTSMMSSGAVADCLLRVDLQEFSQVFDTRESSRGVIQADALLVDGKRRRLGERRFILQQSATAPDARGGVGALVLVVNELGAEMSRWLAELSARQGPTFCRLSQGVK